MIGSEELPKSIIIGGSGAIGTEFGYVLNAYGVDVTIVEFLDRMVPTGDAEISAELLKAYKNWASRCSPARPSGLSRTPAPG